MLARAIEMDAVDESLEVSQERNRSFAASCNESQDLDDESEEDEEAAHKDFVNEIAGGLGMSDEEVNDNAQTYALCR